MERFAVRLGEGPGPRGRIGFIALANGHVSELEVAEMVPRGDVVVYVNRVMDDDVIALDNLRAIEADIARAAAGILPDGRIDVMVYGCTSGTMALGEEAVAARIRSVRPGIPVTTPLTGAIAAFRTLGVSDVAMFTPYSAEVTSAMADYLHRRGVCVSRVATFDVLNGSDMNRIAPSAIREAALKMGNGAAEAVFICCTALRACGVIEEVEQELGKPVVTSNQALAWHALRLIGYDRAVDGYGRLMRLPLAADTGSGVPTGSV